jgi:hypothetical protein
MTLEEFVTQQRDLLEHFQAVWSQRQANEPNNYPNELPPGDWDEQLRFFAEETT